MKITNMNILNWFWFGKDCNSNVGQFHGRFRLTNVWKSMYQPYIYRTTRTKVETSNNWNM